MEPAGGTIVCGVSNSRAGRRTAEAAAALSGRTGLRLVLAHVVAEGAAPPHDAIRRRVRVEELLDSIAAELGCVEIRVVVGGVVDGLARIAAEEGADVIVIGARPLGVRGGHLRCGIAHDLEAATTVPILVAPPGVRSRSSRRLAASR